MTPKVFVDESGNTGSDLSNREQPLFVLASVLPTPELLANLTRVVGGNEEAKFSRLVRSSPGRAKIAAILSHEAVEEDRIRITSYHKRFLATTMVVDILVEPQLYARGVDLYKSQVARYWANTLFFEGSALLGQSEYDRALDDFVRWMRTNDAVARVGFYRRIHRLATCDCSRSLRKVVEWVARSEEEEFQSDLRHDPQLLDPAVPALSSLLGSWELRLDQPFEVVHDEAKTVERARAQFDLVMDREASDQTAFGTGHYAVRYPIRASLRFADSRAEVALQIADLVAGAARHMAMSHFTAEVDTFTRALAKSRFGHLRMDRVWPDRQIVQRGPHHDGRPDGRVVEYVEARAARNKQM